MLLWQSIGDDDDVMVETENISLERLTINNKYKFNKFILHGNLEALWVTSDILSDNAIGNKCSNVEAVIIKI